MTWLDIAAPYLIGLLLVVLGIAIWMAGYHAGLEKDPKSPRDDGGSATRPVVPKRPGGVFN